MLRSFDETAFSPRKKNALYPASKFNAELNIGRSIGFKKQEQKK
jgi:hypothetical protein